MSRREIDDYLEGLGDLERSSLSSLRDAIMATVPEAEECISYGLPAFKLHGKVIAGFGAFKRHLSYFPHSGSVIDLLGHEVRGFGGIHLTGVTHWISGFSLARREH